MNNPLGTVLMIDDEEMDQRQYKRILSRSGLVDEMVQFTYADEALQWLLSKPENYPDLILLDINMPRMDGFEFLAALSDQLGTTECPVIIMLTTSLSPSDRAKADQFPVVRGYFSKPLTPDHLAEAVKILTQTSGG